MLSQEHIETLRSNLQVAEENASRLEGIEGREMAAGYWIGRLESLRSVNSLIGFT